MIRPSPRTFSFLSALVLVVGCSLQDFDYLQHGAGGATSAGGSGSGGNAAAGKSAQGGNDVEGEGGDLTTPGVAGAHNDTGGSGGSAVSTGGKANVAGGPSGGAGGGGPNGQLVNPSFETGNTMGWIVDPPQTVADRHAYVQGPQGTATLPDGKYQLSTWHQTDAFVVDVYQTVEGLRDGSYTFKGYIARGEGFKALQFYAKDCGGAPMTTDLLASAAPDANDWSPITVSPIEVKGGKCTVGVHVDSNAKDWFNADLFSFEPDPDGAGGEGGDGGGGGS
jgi:hypothetical protein